ncbi:aldo/keto reductase [Aliarcobacter cryaerophilus]|uniref:aldo/keto reductase n=1 Tax=Aliarcobacter cryaerophilus TaxID=28198 RepID=UPI0021B1B8EF|nr:aldo/keto reductase [Aliarcobacter cryaerophilus]MCT7483100.1 aldo/keto reductase [Aliarcobacter cryaerophilus]
MNNIEKRLILGTALWGWGVSKKEAFLILDNFVENGGLYIDCATNYPINKNIKDYGLALLWIEEWIKINNKRLFIVVKVGSIDNLGTPNFDLSSNNILTVSKKLIDTFGDSLGCISVHWDNRTENKDFKLVQETVIALKEVKEKNNLSIGLSGIKNSRFYYEAMPDLADDWIIQCKENFLTQEARLNYQEYFPLAKYYAYGINMGGIKLSDEKSVSARIREINYSSKLKDVISTSLQDNLIIDNGLSTVNNLNMSFIFLNTIFNGIIIGPRTVEQLISTFKTWGILSNLDSNKLNQLKLFIDNLHSRIKEIE